MLCDGRMVCGCADPYGKRVLGDTRTETRLGDLDRRAASALRRDINAGGSKFCGDCPLKLPLKKDELPPQRDLNVAALPSRLYIECTAACNISCAQACCAPETGITRTRQAGMLDFELFRRVDRRSRPVARPGRLLQLRRSVPAQARDRDVRVHQGALSRTSTSTRARTGSRSPKTRPARLVHSGIDEVTFSIDGATRGELRQIPPARRLRQGDSQSHARRPTRSARRPRRSVHQLALHPVHAQRQRRGDGARAPDGSRHRRRSPVLGAHRSPGGYVLAPLRAGHAELRRDQARNLGRQQPRQCHPRRHAARANRRQRPLPGLPLIARAGRPVTVPRRRVRNLSTRPFPAQASYGRRLVRARRAALRTRRRADQPRLRARVAAGRRCRRTRAWTCR